MSDGTYVDNSYYFYAPNKGAAIFFSISFLISGVVHTWQAYLLFVAGFVLRVYGAYHYGQLEVYIASLCITYAAPPLLELQNYHILGRALYYVPYHAPLHPGRVLTTFGFISFLIEGLNGWGASYSANQSLSDNAMETGHALIKTSLVLQLVVALCFVTLAGLFHQRCSKHGASNKRLFNTLVTLYASVGLIMVRTIFRTMEYFGLANHRFSDPDFDPMAMSPILRYEVFFYIFEGMLMLCNNLLFNFYHPRRYLPQNSRIYLASDGVTEVEGQGYADSRPLWRTMLDPFDLVGIVRGKRVKHERGEYWEGRTVQSK